VLLAVICAAHEPIGRELLAKTTNLGSEFPRVLVRLAAYIPRQPGLRGQPVYSIYHKSLSDWLTDPDREGQVHFVPLREGHARLAERCWKEYQNGGTENMGPYELTFACVHLKECGRAADACQILETLIHNSPSYSGSYYGRDRLADYENELEELRNEVLKQKRWHPTVAIHIHSHGALFGYCEVFQFPCCGRYVVTSNDWPSQYRADGCEAAPPYIQPSTR